MRSATCQCQLKRTGHGDSALFFSFADSRVDITLCICNCLFNRALCFWVAAIGLGSGGGRYPHKGE